MGIVAYCPNDHRVKVKNDLAGKKGVCPTCGARFRIPFESQPDRKRMGLDGTRPPDAPTPSIPAAMSEPMPALEPTHTPVPPASPSHPSTPVFNPPSAIPVAEIISFDSTLAASLPRALPLASPP